MPCCRGVFQPSPEHGNRGSCSNLIRYSTQWDHQVQSCSQMIYWTCELMVEILEPSRNYQHSDYTQYIVRAPLQVQRKRKISRKTSFQEFINSTRLTQPMNKAWGTHRDFFLIDWQLKSQCLAPKDYSNFRFLVAPF